MLIRTKYKGKVIPIRFLKAGSRFSLAESGLYGKLIYVNQCRAYIQILKTNYCYVPKNETEPAPADLEPETKAKHKDEKDDPRIMFKRGNYLDISPNTMVIRRKE